MRKRSKFRRNVHPKRKVSPTSLINEVPGRPRGRRSGVRGHRRRPEKIKTGGRLGAARRVASSFERRKGCSELPISSKGPTIVRVYLGSMSEQRCESSRPAFRE